MKPSTHRPQQLAWQVFRGSDAVSEGLLTPKALRGLAWKRVRYDVYADSRLEHDHLLACHSAALILPPSAVITGPSAAVVHGVAHSASYADPVHVTVPPSAPLGHRDGLSIHRMDLEPGEIQRLDWGRVSTPVRTAWDVAAWLPPVTAVPIIDVLLRTGAVVRDRLEAIVARHDGQRGGQRARRAVELSDGRAQSPPESVLRVRLVLKGLPPPVPQARIVLSTGAVFHPDLAWTEYKVAVEYDGLWHATAEQLHLDRRRLNQLLADGWIVLHVTSERMRRDFGGFLVEARRALRSRGWQPA